MTLKNWNLIELEARSVHKLSITVTVVPDMTDIRLSMFMVADEIEPFGRSVDSARDRVFGRGMHARLHAEIQNKRGKVFLRTLKGLFFSCYLPAIQEKESCKSIISSPASRRLFVVEIGLTCGGTDRISSFFFDIPSTNTVQDLLHVTFTERTRERETRR